MKPLAIYILLMLNNMPAFAQSKKVISIEWKTIAELPPFNNQSKSIGVAGPIVGVINNKLIVAAGANFPDKMPWQGGKKAYYNNIVIFKKEKGQVLQETIAPSLVSNIAYAANCSTPFGIVFAGGENELGLSDKVYLLKWDEASNNLLQTKLPDLPVKTTNGSLVCIDKILYFLGGETLVNTTNQFFSLNLNKINDGWTMLPAIPKPLSNTVVVAQYLNGQKQIYLMGGRAKQKNGISDFSSDVYSFDIHLKRWDKKKSLPYPISAGTGAVVTEKYILLFGGDRGEQFNKVERTISSINLEKDELRKENLITIKNKLLESHPGFSNEILLYNTQKNIWTSTGFIPFDTSVTTNVVQWGDEIIIPSGEIKAGVRTPRILSAKIILHE
ncbi:MAG: galactose oxidase [Chitinophagia bacterium]|jgi:N-acetylneuraminate epimerase|nr:galactose oxidase [Chitinophagia bacterium]